MSDQQISSKLRAIADGPKKTDTARLRDIFDDVEYALARKTQSDVLSILHEEGFKFTEAGFRYSLAKIRRERGTGRMSKKKEEKQQEPTPTPTPPPPPAATGTPPPAQPIPTPTKSEEQTGKVDIFTIQAEREEEAKKNPKKQKIRRLS